MQDFRRRGNTMDLGIAGKVALLTGASSGTGYACAEVLAGEGVRVAICARGREGIETAAHDIAAKTGGEVIAFVADVSRAEDIDRLLCEVTKRLETIDILLANNGGQASSACSTASRPAAS